MPAPVEQTSPRIALVHATRIAIPAIEEAMARLWPEAEAVSLMDEALSADRAKSRELSPALHGRIGTLARYGRELGAKGILFTCSAFGAAIEKAGKTMPLPVLKPNEAMFEAALETGRRFVMIHTFAPAAEGMIEEFREEAERRGGAATLRSIFCDGALDALRFGHAERHDRLIADCAATVKDADAILLAQFSMARAGEPCRARTDLPVLTSPEEAVRKLRRLVEERGADAC